MHPAPVFRNDDEARLLAELAAQPFATVSAAPDGRPRVAHVPVLARRLPQGLVVDFHVSRNNALAPFLETGFRAVVSSLSTAAYVSPDWMQGHDHVPTWNYVSVEAEGPVAAIGEDGLVALLDDLSAQEEARLAPKPPWTRGKMTPGRFETLTGAIVGVRLTVERLEGVTKLSQNRSDADRAGIVAALGDHEIARRMRD